MNNTKNKHGRVNSPSGLRGGVPADEIARIVLRTGAIIRARKTGDAPAIVEIWGMGFREVSADAALDLISLYGNRVKTFILENAPHLLEAK